MDLTLTAGIVLGLLGRSMAYPPSPSHSPGSWPSDCNETLTHPEPHTIESAPGIWPWQVFQSSPFNPPELAIVISGAPLAPGLVFFEPANFSPVGAVKQPTPFIMTDTGELVYSSTVENATDFRVQIYNGEPYLTFWSGYNTNGANIGHGYGSVTFLDTTYNQAYHICPQLDLVTGVDMDLPCQIDIHEHQLTDSGTILVSAYNITPADLRALGGPVDGYVYDCLVFEIDVQTSDILFHWSALEHVPIADTRQPLAANKPSNNGSFAAPFDYFHLNSIEAVGANYLINSRHIFTTYLVNKQGDILWQLNGDTGGDFGPLPEEGKFRWQHYVRVQEISDTSITISMFDNHNSVVDNGTTPTAGLELQLTLPPSHDSSPVVTEHLTVASEEIYADSQGSYSILEAGNQFMGYGQIAIMREYGPAPDGSDLRWEARFGIDNLVQSYRALKQEWHATPTTNPSLVVQASASHGSGSVGYVSWNGATDLTAWNIYEGSQASQLSLIGQVASAGFETAFNVAHMPQCLQVGAVREGVEIRRSDVVCS